MTTGQVLSLKIAQPKMMTFESETIETAIQKQPVSHVDVNEQGIIGNDVGLKAHHGGVDKAVFFMGEETFYTLNRLTQSNFTYDGTGVYGENIVVSHFDERNVCIGDRFQLGSCEFEVSQPRRPCSRLSKNTGVATMKEVIFEQGLTGWYVRVIKAGSIKQGDQVILKARPYPQWTIANLNHWLALDTIAVAELTPLLDCDILAEAFKAAVRKRLNGESGKVKG